ncbi:integrase [Pseudoalteromonas sp. HM-SA03]|uniref:site-specific integrase n=1 Tax=Pseudoalteromonas sp. HM-SA03 TaxID=2029678 RepID=UPI000BADF596|nr:site-specific integrase [Pseudoalteromonas sp. HM-SA03]PAX99096.1 integrase [Pseudoalteromonas sp. HM-SA03]
MPNSTKNLITLESTCFNEDELIGALAPDSLTFNKSEELDVPHDFVLCRDENNNVTAMYGENKWDFNPYRLSADKISTFNFETISEDNSSPQKSVIISEMKNILFHLMYSRPAGHTGMLAVSTLYNYYIVLSKAAKYCFSLSNTLSLDKVTLKDLFSDERLFTAFVIKHQKPSFNNKAKALVGGLFYLGEPILKFDVSGIVDVDIERLDNDQTVIIPQRIYMLIGDHLESSIKHIFEHSKELPKFLTKLKDPFYGLSHERQKSQGVGGKAFWRSDMPQAIKEHGLDKLFSGEYKVLNRNSLQLQLTKIQYLCKLALHYYTGMRNQEVQRMKPNAINETIASKEVKDQDGKVIDKAKIVEVVSSTTKFTGQRIKVSWFAPKEVKMAVSVLERIHKGLSELHNLQLKDDWLFVSSSILKLNKTYDGTPVTFKTKHKPSWLKGLLITELDFKELNNSDDERDFLLEKKYQIGNVWHLHSHQFRRSLAYYASNAGFVSEASLKSQLKHITRAMSRYYSNNFEKAESIFGYFDEKTGKYLLPPEHIIHEFRTGIPFNMADHVLNDILGSEEPLYGKTGSYIERQNEQLRKGEVLIDSVRTETAMKVEKGEFAYRETLLGGCTKVGDCDSFMLGDFTSCLPCEGAIIKESKVDREIKYTQEELALYEEGSGEYQITKANLDALLKYREHRMNRKPSESEEIV